MKHVKLLSTFGKNLALTDTNNSNFEEILLKRKEIEREKEKKMKNTKHHLENDIFQSNYKKQESNSKYKKHLVLTFQNHNLARAVRKETYQPDLCLAKSCFNTNGNNAIDYSKTLIRTLPRIPRVLAKKIFYVNTDFKVEHPNFISMDKMKPRANIWVKESKSQSSLSNDHKVTESQTPKEHVKELNHTVPLKKHQLFYYKEMPRQIIHTPNMNSITPKIKGIIDFKLSDKKTESRVNHSTFRYKVLDSQKNPEIIDYSLDCISKNTPYANFTRSSERGNGKSNLPIFMCNIHSGNGGINITDKSLQMNNFSERPIPSSELSSFNKLCNHTEPSNFKVKNEIYQNTFINLKNGRYDKFLKHISKQMNYFKMNL